MADPDGELTVAQRLGRALDRGLLPAGGPAEAAERLIERLERPARVALLGLPGSGKSSILNLLVGAAVVPETLRLPTIVVKHGDVSRMICTLTDGTTRILPGTDLAEVLPLAPALVTLEMDLPALHVISLLEVSAGPMEAEQRRAATWASKRADIVIWCTTSYLPKEQAVWESLPDAVKDNSFMFLTKVDLLGSRESALAMHDRVELRAGEEFRQILSISARQARAAMPANGQVNRELFRDSGAGAVITAIKTRVQSGRRADMDTAELLLARHVEASELVARRFAETGDEIEAPKAWTPPPEPEPVPVAPEPEPVEPEAVAAPTGPEMSDPEPETVDEEPLPEPEPEAAAQPEELPATDGADEAADRARPDPAQAPSHEPEPAASDEAEEDTELTTRRRFADRIKRVASDADPSPAPAVPLRSTWKSKGEAPAQSAPEPAPLPRETGRRPRASAQTTTATEDAASPLPEATDLPAETSPPELEAEPSAEAIVPPDHPARPERTARAVTPRPDPAVEAARLSRPQLFGARRGAERGAGGSPLPDLSSLRATPEEMEAALEASEQAAMPEADELAAGQDAPGAADLATPEASPPEPADAAPIQPAERPRISARARPVEPAAVPLPDPGPAAAPVSSAAAGRRVSATAAPLTPPEETQFSARSIMQRAPRTEPDAPAPRRERARITAKVVPAAATPAAPAPVSAIEHALVEEAIGLIALRSTELEREVASEAKIPVDLILEHAQETGEKVMAVVSRGRSEELRRINGDLGEVMDLIMLMQLEKGHAPADDALTMILQLKRELETLRTI